MKFLIFLFLIFMFNRVYLIELPKSSIANSNESLLKDSPESDSTNSLNVNPTKQILNETMNELTKDIQTIKSVDKSIKQEDLPYEIINQLNSLDSKLSYELDQSKDSLANAMNDEEERIEPQEDGFVKFDKSFSDYPTVFNSIEEDDETPSKIISNACEIDRCKSVNATSKTNSLNLVGCSSIELDYNCYYCAKDFVLLKHKYSCVGPCNNDLDCQNLTDFYKRVECPYGYLEEGSR